MKEEELGEEVTRVVASVAEQLQARSEEKDFTEQCTVEEEEPWRR
jgi:hypothetical protein